MREFKEIPGTNGRYAASNDGHILNVKRNRLLSQHLNQDGYPRTNLYMTVGQQRPIEIHRFVAMAWHDNPLGLATVNHIDGNKQNNSIENLEWVSQRDNNLHAIRLGLNKVFGGKPNAGRKSKKGIPTGRSGKFSARSKPVIEFDNAGNQLAFYESARLAALKEGLPAPTLRWGCNHNTPVRGRHFRYQQNG